MSDPRSLALGLIAGLAFFATGGCGDSRRPTGEGPSPTNRFPAENTASAQPNAPARPPTNQELAVIAPLTTGTKISDFDVVEIRGVTEGGLDLVVRKGAARIVLTVALLAQGGPPPPASTDRYAIFYSLRGAEPADGERVAKALAAVLEANKAAPPPPGMGAFVPRPVSL